MPYVALDSKVRKDPLGPGHLGALKTNGLWLRDLLGREHIISTGEHNALEVPRVVRRINNTTVSPSSSDISSVTHTAATGQYVVNLAASRFSADIRAQLNVKPESVKPHLGVITPVSATVVNVQTFALTSALGAGNAWAATDLQFDLALHSTPLDAGTWATTPDDRFSGDYLDDGALGWNAYVQSDADVRAMLLAEHDSGGLHVTRQVAKASAMCRSNGAGSYTLDSDVQRITSVTSPSTGKAVVTTADTLTSPLHVFVAPDYARLGGGSASTVLLVNAWEASTTTVNVQIFAYDPATKTWALADADFFIAIHG